MNVQLGRAVLLVKDYDEALRFYQTNFECKVLFDQDSSFGLRYLHIGFEGETGIWLLKAESQAQDALIGNQTGGQPTLVFYTSDLQELYNKLLVNGVTITHPPANNPEYSFFQCEDLYGNGLVVVQLKQAE